MIALLLLAAGCSDPARRPERIPRSEIAAEVGEAKILVRDVEARMRAERLSAREATERLIDEEIAAQAAVRLGLIPDRDVALARRRAAIQKLLAVEVEERISVEDVSEAEIALEYRKNEALTADHIIAQVEQGAAAEVQARARQLAERIREAALSVADGRAFGALASRFTSAEIPVLHEDLGEFIDNGAYVQAFVEQAMRLHAPGEISEPIQTPFGWHVIRLRSRRNLLGPSAADARPRILERVLGRLRRARYDDLVRSIQKRARIEIDESALAPAEGS